MIISCENQVLLKVHLCFIFAFMIVPTICVHFLPGVAATVAVFFEINPFSMFDCTSFQESADCGLCQQQATTVW